MLGNWVLIEHEVMRPKLTQAEGFIMGVGAKMFSCCGARCAPWRRRACVAHRPQPLARLLPPATGGSRLAPHRRACDRLWCQCQCGVWVDLLDYNIILTRMGLPHSMRQPHLFMYG